MVAVLGHLAVFSVYFTYVNLTDVPLPFIRRYLLQVYSGLLALFFVMSYQLYRQSNDPQLEMIRQQPRRIGIWLLGFILVLFSIGSVSGYSGYKLPESGNNEVLAMLDYAPGGEASVRDIVDACFNSESAAALEGGQVVRNNGIFWSNQGQILHLYLGVSSIALANRYHEEPLDFDELARQIDAYNIRMLILAPDLGYESESKVLNLLDWVKQEGLPTHRYSGYHNDPSRFTELVFLDPACKP